MGVIGEILEFLILAVPWLVVAGLGVFAFAFVWRQIVVPLWRRQYMFPHHRDPIVMALDKIELDRKEAFVRSARAQADFDIALSDVATRKKEKMTNLQIRRIHSGEVEDDVTRLLNEKARRLEEMAKNIRDGNFDVDQINVEEILSHGPIPDLGEGSEKERGSQKNKVR
ncbi:MAG: hypothetical protein HY226_03000 [Candidatus Vogelbacteria bacterium]|nr:hypothetical protein [Candidatus Vogelbacteria bacterium]